MQKRILLFEDDFESMRDLKEHLEETFGWQVTLAADQGLPGRLGSERFDCVIIDAMVRPTSLDENGLEVQNVHFDAVSWLETGLEFLRRLRRGEYSRESGVGTPATVPVIVLSATTAGSIRQALGAGVPVEGWAEKPFRLDDLVAHIRRVMQE